MRFGFHISISGGFSNIVKKAMRKQCQTIQFFSRNPRGWAYKGLNPDGVRAFKDAIKQTGISPVFVHMPYLANFASFNEILYQKSIDALCEDLRRSRTLGAQFLILHIGHRGSKSEDEAVERISRGINKAITTVQSGVKLLLENTAGQGTEVGYSFAQLKKIISAIDDNSHIGLCLDVAHAFEAGYDVSTEKGLEKTLNELETLIGLKNLYLLHLNDSKTPLGSRVDRHWHIGKGFIGTAGFRLIVNHKALQHLPGIMETPRKSDKEDLHNMGVIKSLVNI